MVRCKNIFGLVLAGALLLPGAMCGMDEKKKEDVNLKKEVKKSHVVRNIGLAAVSLGLLSAASYGTYWSNNYDLKKTLRPLLSSVLLPGACFFAAYHIYGKYMLSSVIKKSTTLVNKEYGAVMGQLAKKLEEGQDLLAFISKRVNPFNAAKSDADLKQLVKIEKQLAQNTEKLNEEEKKKLEEEKRKMEEDCEKERKEIIFCGSRIQINENNFYEKQIQSLKEENTSLRCSNLSLLRKSNYFGFEKSSDDSSVDTMKNRLPVERIVINDNNNFPKTMKKKKRKKTIVTKPIDLKNNNNNFRF